MKRSALVRRTRLQAKTPLRRSSVPLTRAPLVLQRPKPKLVLAQKRRLVDRSGGFCELRIQAVCIGKATDVAHRIGEGMGGRHRAAAEANDRLGNVLHACQPCHRHTHDFPATARGHGWMLPRGADPLAAPLLYAGRGWCLLDNDGGVTRL